MYLFQLFDAFSGSGSVLLLVVLGECLAIGWFYGKKSKQMFHCSYKELITSHVNNYS